MSVDATLFCKESTVQLTDIMGNVSFAVHPDSYKWSLGLTDWPFWGDDVEHHTLELRVALQSNAGPIVLLTPEPVLEAPHVFRYDMSAVSIHASMRVLDVASVDGAAALVTHMLSTSETPALPRLHGIMFVFPKFAHSMAYDPDISVLLDQPGNKAECGGGGGESSTTVLLAIASASVPGCILCAIVLLALYVAVERARRWWAKRGLGRGQVNFDKLDGYNTLTEFQPVEMQILQTQKEATGQVILENNGDDGGGGGDQDELLSSSSSSSSARGSLEAEPDDVQYFEDAETGHIFPAPINGPPSLLDKGKDKDKSD